MSAAMVVKLRLSIVNPSIHDIWVAYDCRNPRAHPSRFGRFKPLERLGLSHVEYHPTLAGLPMRRLFLPAAVACLVLPLYGAAAQCASSTQHLINDAKYQEARAELSALLKKNTADDAAMECMGRVYTLENDAGKAADWFEQAV